MRLLACRRRLGVLAPEDIVDLASRFMDEGVWSAAIDEAYDYVYPWHTDLWRAFDTILADHGIVPPPVEEAAEIVLRQVMRCILDGSLDPRAGADRIQDDVQFVVDQFTEQYVGDGLGIAQMIGLHWAYEDLYPPDDPTRQALIDAAVLEEAAAWLAAHPIPKSESGERRLHAD